MENREIEEKIRRDMDAYDVPDSLSPEEVEKRLEHVKQRKRFFAGNRRKGLIAACAAFVVLLSAGTFALSQHFWATNYSASTPQSVNSTVAESDDTSYKEISKLINEYNKKAERAISKGAGVDTAIPEDAEAEDSAELQENTGDMVSKSSDSISGSTSSGSSPSYSETDTQVKGVMEGDVVKTDGSHIFSLKSATTGFQVKIYDVNGANVKDAGTIFVKQKACEEMYIEETTLILICRDWESDQTQTDIYLYDVSDTSSPKEICHHTQDGYFQTSRLTGGHLYTFSYFITDNTDCSPKHPEKFVPLVDNEPVAEEELSVMDDIAQNSYVVMTSLNIKKYSSFTDRRAVFGGSDVYYMSNQNIYLVNRGYNRFRMYEGGDGEIGDLTTISKYYYHSGVFTSVASIKIQGEISNSYYMHEYEDNFIFVYTKYGKNGGTDNGLCVMGRTLETLGEIDGLGKNETIYASYYIDNMAYFVTYRNTDPVFAVDISNPEKPTLKSELKLPGFSDYLHSFGDNTLLGIGMSDEDEDRVKLSLFSISDKMKLKEIAKTKLSEYTYCIAGRNHRAVFVDEERGLVGLGVEHEDWYDDENCKTAYTYEVYQYKDKKFTKVISCPILYSYESLENARGLRIGDYFYVVDVESGVDVFDINTWKKAK